MAEKDKKQQEKKKPKKQEKKKGKKPGTKYGPKSKYESHVLPRLVQIEGWLRQGATEQEVAENLGISKSTFCAYLQKANEGEKRYSDLLDCCARARACCNEAVEGALFKATQGYNATIRKAVKMRRVEYDPETGRKIKEWDEIEYVDEEVHIAPSVDGQKFWLANRDKGRWKYKPDEQTERIESQSGIALIPEVMADG